MCLLAYPDLRCLVIVVNSELGPELDSRPRVLLRLYVYLIPLHRFAFLIFFCIVSYLGFGTETTMIGGVYCGRSDSQQSSSRQTRKWHAVVFFEVLRV